MTDNTTKPRKFYTTRAEYFACREDVEAMLKQGYSIRLIYERMEEEQRITCSYSAFCDYVRGNGKRLHSRKKEAPKAPAAISMRQESHRGFNQNTGTFPAPRTMNVTDAL